MFCTSPIVIYKRDVRPGINPATGLPEWPMVACGKCPTCVAGRKNDWSGRLVAEAKAAADVYFVTLTYSQEPDDFRYADVQTMLKQLRIDLERKYSGTKLRFFCVGERGNKFGRIHWHLLIFADQRLGWGAWNKRTKTKQLWPYWPHGWTDIAPVPAHDTVRRVRYCAKYAVKTVGQEDKACRFRCSLKPAIGWAYIANHVDDLVEAGLPLKGWFSIPGMEFTSGTRKGQLQRFRLRGASARNAARRYAELWIEKRPTKVWPRTPFFLTYFREELMWRRAQWPESTKPFDWSRDPDLTPDFRAVNPFRERLEADKQRFDHDWQAAADEAQREAYGLSDLQAAYGCEFARLRYPERLREVRADQAQRAGYRPGDSVGDRFIEDGSFPEAGDDKARRLREIRWDEGDGFVRFDNPGARIREIDCRQARAGFDRQASAINARGFEAVEGFDPETGEIRAEVGPQIVRVREAVKRQPDRAYEPIPWVPKAGGLVERAFAATGTVGRGFFERQRALA